MSHCLAVQTGIIIYEGGTFDQAYLMKSGSPAIAVDLTGYTAVMTVRSKINDTTPRLLKLTSFAGSNAADGTSGIYIPNQTGSDIGKFIIYIKDEDTFGMCALKHKDLEGVYDLFLYNPDGEAEFKVYGNATIRAAATRSYEPVGTSGYSAIGIPGTSGTSGSSGTSGIDGTFFGSSGTSGYSGTSGSSGTSGVGTSGTSGLTGSSGTSGVD